MSRQRKRKKTEYRSTVPVLTTTKQGLKNRAAALRCTQNQLAVALIGHELAKTTASATLQDREFQVIMQSFTELIGRLRSLWFSIAQQRNETLLQDKKFAGEETLAEVKALFDQAIAARHQLCGIYAGKNPDLGLANYLWSAQVILADVFASGGDTTAQDIAEYLITLNILSDPRPRKASGG